MTINMQWNTHLICIVSSYYFFFFQINELTGMTSKWSNKTAADEQVQECHRNCVEYQGEVNELLKQAKLLELVSVNKLFITLF